jgi:adenylate cyclase
MRRLIILQANVIVVPISVGIAVYNALWQPPGTGDSRLHQVVLNLIQAVLVVIVIDIGSDIVLGYWLRRHIRWAVGDGEPNEGDRMDLLRLPVRAALTILLVVLGSVVLITAISLATGTAAISAFGIAFSFFLAGFTFALVVYLQVERSMRPLFALALTGTPVPDRRLVGVRPRLLVAWMLGSAAPLLFILVIPFRDTKGDLLPLLVPVIYMAASGLVLGAVTTLLAARSVFEPITQVRLGLQRVGAGDLDTELEVTTPGDLGQLQAGFNTMVSGLRERRTLEDLFGRHVGADVAAQAVGTGLELGGETRTVSVLFVDIIGSTAFAESHDPRTVVSRVNELFELVFDVVNAEGGWINKFEGDGCLCVFGAPSDLADHCGHGLRAARILAERVVPLTVEVGIGVSSGEVVAGNVGSVERFEYTVMGRPVNEAARLTDAAKAQPGHVLATWHTIEAAGAEADHWQRADDLTLRGVQAPVEVGRPTP